MLSVPGPLSKVTHVIHAGLAVEVWQELAMVVDNVLSREPSQTRTSAAIHRHQPWSTLERVPSAPGSFQPADLHGLPDPCFPSNRQPKATEVEVVLKVGEAGLGGCSHVQDP